MLKSLIIKQNCSPLCMVTGTLLKSGVELVRSLEIAQGAVTNTVMADVIAETRRKLMSELRKLESSKQELSKEPPIYSSFPIVVHF